jgi:cytochrome c oxidase subunit II
LWRLYTSAAAIVGGIVIGLIAVAAVRFRRRAGEQELPRQRLHAVKLESTYLTLPLLLVVALVVATVIATERVLASEGDPDVTVDVIAYRWQWYFAYEGEDVVVTGGRDDEPELVLPAPAKVRFEGTSRDVIHALWVPEFLFKRDLIPGATTTFDVDTVEVGEYWGRCAEFCGLDHAIMSFRVRTVSPDEFRTWLDDQRRSAAGTSTAGGRP